MSIICSKCSKPAIIYIRYNGTHLCKEHFIIYFHRRVKKEIRKQGTIPSHSKIGVAISGGKDSIVALQIMHEFYGKRKDIEIIGISIDEGIKGYRNDSLKIAADQCQNLGITHYIISFKERIGKTMDEIMNLDNRSLGACSYCGVFRRFCLNTLSKELKIKRLITGHNLDDMAQSIFMNFINADMEKLARLGPHLKIQPGLIPRMMPLRVIPEKENALYAMIQGYQVHDAECPYAIEASRQLIKDIVYNLEEKNPGTRHSIIKSYDSIKELLIKKYPSVELLHCPNCNEPTIQSLCKTCLLKSELKLI
jgi:uncharacterized protein (TIGR00269 family)